MATEGEARPEPGAAGGEPSARTLERLQQELADTRAALQTEAQQLAQLQEALEAALRVARSVRLDPHTQLDRLAQELLESARAEAEQIRQQAEQEAQARREQLAAELDEQRARAEREIAERRAAAEAELSELRAAFEREVQAAQQEFDRIATLLQNATQVLAATRLVPLAARGAPPAAAEPTPSGPPAGAVSAPPQSPAPQPPAPPPEVTERGAPPPTAAEAPAPTPSPAEAPASQPAEPPAAPSRPASFEAGCRLLDQGDVPGALDAFRGIVDREPEHVEPVIGRLAAMMRDPALRAYHEEIRLLLVDAYMVQGDYDRAMSLLHEPGG
jgi:hypothetical protein